MIPETQTVATPTPQTLQVSRIERATNFNKKGKQTRGGKIMIPETQKVATPTPQTLQVSRIERLPKLAYPGQQQHAPAP